MVAPKGGLSNCSNVDAMHDFRELNRHIRLDKGSVERLILMSVS